MLTLKEIKEIIKAIDQSSLDEFIYEHEGNKLKLRKNNNQIEKIETLSQPSTRIPNEVGEKQIENNQSYGEASVNQQASVSFDYEIKSPMVGTFYHSSSPDADPFVQKGDKVNKNTVVCIVEAMKLFNEIEADVEGEIVEVLVENGELVEYGQPLFRIKEN